MGNPNAAPFEIIAAPFEAWVAPVGTAFPAVDADPGVGWTKVGTHGADSYDESGVTVTPEETLAFIRSAGSTGAKKAVRTEENLTIGFVLQDLTLEQVQLALNGNAITATNAGAGV